MSKTSKASERIHALLDANSFVEIGALVTARATDFNLAENDTPSDGVVTGYGVIDGNLVYVYSQDASVMNGSVGEMHAKKITKIYDLALKTGAPVIGLIDSTGLRLQEATDALNAFGEIYMKQTMASGVIPQITAIFGNCGGGLAIIPTLTDFTFMESKSAKLFVNAPNALDGNTVAKCDSASSEFHAKESGIVDVVADEADLLNQVRALVAMLPSNFEEEAVVDCADDLNRACATLESAKGNMVAALAELSDNAQVFEIKKDYATDMVTAFIKLNGMTVGAVANNEDTLSIKGSYKAADFVRFCDAFNIPVLTLTNVKGYEATIGSEKGIATAVAKLTHAFASATVPKVNVVVGDAFGSAYVAMNSKAIGADIVMAWPNAQIGAMDATLAAKIMYDGKDSDTIKAKANEYKELQNSALSAARRGYVDHIVQPADTRKYVIGAFEMLYSKVDNAPAKKHGTV